MPKTTFQNLSPEKRKRITDAFLREFAVKSYDEASITVVVKALGIAKGSVYQYFADKQDLFLYLLGVSTSVKLSYVQSIRRADYPDYWAYFRDLYVHGFRFDQEHPLESHFLHQLAQNLNSPSIKHLYDQLMLQSIQAFEAMAAYEIEQGLFRDDSSAQVMGYMLYKVGVSIQEYLAYTGVIQPLASIAANLPVYQGKKAALMGTVDAFIHLTRAGFDKK